MLNWLPTPAAHLSCNINLVLLIVAALLALAALPCNPDWLGAAGTLTFWLPFVPLDVQYVQHPGLCLRTQLQRQCSSNQHLGVTPLNAGGGQVNTCICTQLNVLQQAVWLAGRWRLSLLMAHVTKLSNSSAICYLQPTPPAAHHT